MATKKPTVKKLTTAKKPITAKNKPTKKAANKKIEVKPPVKTEKKPTKTADKKGLGVKMTKLTVDRVELPKGGKVFVKAAKRPTTKKPAKKTK